jgi:hypothetical protein
MAQRGVSTTGNLGRVVPALGQSFPHMAQAVSMAFKASARTVPAVSDQLSFAETRGPSSSARHSCTNAKHFFGLRTRNSACRINNATGNARTPYSAPRRRSVVQLMIAGQAPIYGCKLRYSAAHLAAGAA